jgi:FixJ family two-component response regulator
MSYDDTDAPTISIAIVDDEDSVRTGLRRLCSALGFRTTVYASGSEFIEALESGAARPDCLLLDAHMPQMSGLEVQRHLVMLGVRIPSIVYTADDAPEVKARYFAAGVAAYLCKPIAGDDLIAVIERIMTRPHPWPVDQRPTAGPTPQL